MLYIDKQVAGLVALWLAQTASSYSDTVPAAADVASAVSCASVTDTLDFVRSDTMNLFIQLPLSEYTSIASAVCDSTTGCASDSSGNVCSGRGECRYGICVCSGYYTGEYCEVDEPTYQLYEPYCCAGEDLSYKTWPHTTIAFMWTDFHPEILGNVYVGSVDSDTLAIVFEEVVAYSIHCFATIEVLLHRSGAVEIEYLRSMFGNTPECSVVNLEMNDISIGFKSDPDDSGDLPFQQIYGPSIFQSPNEMRVTMSPLFSVTSNENSSDDDEESFGVIIGAVVGAVVLLLAAIGGVWYCRVRIKKERDNVVSHRTVTETGSTANPIQTPSNDNL